MNRNTNIVRSSLVVGCARLARGVGAIGLLAVCACNANDRVNEPAKRLGPLYLTPVAALSLDESGRFRFDVSRTAPTGQVNEEQARAIATRYVRAMYPYLKSLWESGHGSQVDGATLAACDRALYADSPYASISGEASELTLRTFGPHWIVPMCGKGRVPQVVVSLSSMATELAAASPSGPQPWDRANLTAFGIPASAAAWMYNPEQASAYAFGQSGRRINAVPQLVGAAMPETPVLVRWRVDLETPVSLTGVSSSVSRDRQSVWVGFGETFRESGLLDSDPRASTAPLEFEDAVTHKPIKAVLRSDAPIALERVRRGTP